MTIASMAFLTGLLVSAPTEQSAPTRGLPQAYPRRSDGVTTVSQRWPLPPFEVEAEPEPTETLAEALEEAYRTAPGLQADRYDLRATDEDYALALAETRPTTQLQVSGGYDRTNPGRFTDSRRSLVDQLSSSTITNDAASANFTIDQPLYTGGRATADREVASHAITAGRAALRGSEGDLFLQVVTVYADIRRDGRVLALRAANLKQLDATLAEVVARREAGELTRTDIAQAETQRDLARAQYNSSVQQLEQDRAAYAALVGRDAGVLAPEPSLPGFPTSIEQAFDVAARRNPDIAQAIAAEKVSRSRIAVAASEGQPRLSLRGTATLSDRLLPLRAYNADRGFTGQAILSIPLTNGGRVGALIAQAKDRNVADRVRIEAARRQIVQSIVGAWNAVATAERNIEVQSAQRASARTLNEGTFEEYRAGLRSTFDVLFAQGSLRDAEISLVASRRDLYVAQASVLRQIGMLEAATLLNNTPLYDPSVNLKGASDRGAMLLDDAVRAFDRFDRRLPKASRIEQPSLPAAKPALTSAAPLLRVDPTSHTPNQPLPGTTGIPASLKGVKP